MRGEHSPKFSAPKLLRLGSEGILKIFSQRVSQCPNYLINESVTKVFVEEPQLHRSVKHMVLNFFFKALKFLLNTQKSIKSHGRSPPQELEEGPRSGLYLIVLITTNNMGSV